MDSDNENSVASSASSLQAPPPQQQQQPHFHYQGSRHGHRHTRRHFGDELDVALMDDDIDMQSDGSDFNINTTDLTLNNGLNGTLHEGEPMAELGPIRKIPTEVLLLIFSQISHKSELVPLLRVCKRWSNLIVELLWFRPSLMTSRAMSGLQQVMSMNPNETYWNYRPFIRRLNLSFIYERVDSDFLNLFEGCYNLERLTLVNCSRLSSESICNVLQNCSKLQSIDMTGVKSIDDDIFEALGQNCPRLQGLYAPGCKSVTRRGISAIYNSCPMLKRMKLSDNLSLTDEDLWCFVNNCKSLIEVDVHNCVNLTNDSLITLFVGLEQLREFRISQNMNVTDQLFRSIPEDAQFDRLRIIDFTGCTQITDQSVERIVQAAPRLRNVVLSKCTMVTDSSLRSLARLGKNLHYVHLGHCTHITDLGIIILARSCHRLQYIDLACCQQLTNNSLIELAHLARLRRIGLVKCLNITDLGIHNFVIRRGHDDTLERVHLSYCTNLGLSPILDLLRACPRLTHLSLTGIRAFLRPDILCYCREPPSDFNEHQRALFCVFSGQGVRKLREFLINLYETRPEEFNSTRLIDGQPLVNLVAGIPIRGFPVQIPPQQAQGQQQRQQQQDNFHAGLMDRARRQLGDNGLFNGFGIGVPMNNNNNNIAEVQRDGQGQVQQARVEANQDVVMAANVDADVDVVEVDSE